MEIVFKNDSIISKSNAIDSKILAKISMIYLKYTKDLKEGLYSSFSNMPISHIYCTTGLDGALSSEKILIGEIKIGDSDQNLYSKFELIDANDINYIERFRLMSLENQYSKSLDKDIMKVILYRIFTMYMPIEKLYIICDEEGDNYNLRSIDILQQIYKKSPYFIRKSIGYNSYSLEEKNSSRVKLIVTTKSNFKIDDGYIVDLNSSDYRVQLSEIEPSINKFLDLILSLSDEQLTKIYDKIYDIYKLKRLKIKELIDVFSYLEFYENKELNDELIENWIYDINRSQLENNDVSDELYAKMVYDVKHKIDNINLNKYIKNNFYNTKDLNKIDKYSKEAFKFIYYMEFETEENKPPIFKVDNEIIAMWLEEKRYPYIKENYEQYELVQVLRSDKIIIENLEKKLGFSISNIDDIKEKALDVLNKLLVEEEKNIELEETTILKTSFEDIGDSFEKQSCCEEEIEDDCDDYKYMYYIDEEETEDDCDDYKYIYYIDEEEIEDNYEYYKYDSIITDSIYKSINIDINRFFRNLIFIPQDTKFENMLQKANSSYAKFDNQEPIYMIFDNNIHSIDAEGFIITKEYVYYKSTYEKSDKILIVDIEEVKLEGELLFINNIGIKCSSVEKDYRQKFSDFIFNILYLLKKPNEIEVEQGEICLYDTKNNINKYPDENKMIVYDCSKSKFENNTSLTTVIIDNSVKYIGENAFKKCKNLKEIEIPNSVVSIKKEAFNGCESLNKIEIPNSVASIDEGAFSGCTNLKEVKISNSITIIKKLVFLDCENLTKIEIPEYVMTISEHAFYFCKNLKEIKMLNGVKFIRYNAFGYCKSLRKIEIPKSVTFIDKDAFKNCSDELYIYCNKDSYAEKYAKDNNIKFKYL